MNIRLVIFSSVITALIGATLGLVAAEMSKTSLRQAKYQSEFYQQLNSKYYPLIGAGLGLAFGLGQECVRELKTKRDEEEGESKK